MGLARAWHLGGLGAGGGDAMTPPARARPVDRGPGGARHRPGGRRCSRCAIRLESPGHPLYTQTRVGKDGELFQIYKLRTMVRGAEFTGAGLAIQEGDERITRIGAFLRRYSLDELPNLWNVLRGEMSIVGPRPTLAVQVEQYTDRQRGPARGQAGDDRLGPDQRPRLAALARADRARPVVRRAPLAAARTCRSSPGRCGWFSGATGSTRARRADGRRPTRDETP